MRRWICGVALALGACGGTTHEAPEACARVGQQCPLAKGGLGVCQRATDQRQFVCTPQH